MSYTYRNSINHWLTIVFSAFMIAGLIFGASPAGRVSAADQTLGGTPTEGYLRITSKDNGQIGVERYASNAWQRQIYSIYSKGSVIYYNGTKYSLGYFSGTAATFVSNDKSGSTITSKWTAGNLSITRVITYNNGDAYFRLDWTIVNNTANIYSDTRFLHGEDTYLKGGDNGAGWWDAANNTIGVRKTISGVEQRMSLQGITVPYAYQSNNYSSVYSAVSAGALTKAIDPNESTDNGYALEWRTSLAANGTWNITAYEKFIAGAIGALQVIAPTAVDCNPGSACSLTFTVRNPTGSTLGATLGLSNTLGWTASINGSSSISVPANGSVSVGVSVTAGSAGSTSYVSLTATPSTGQSSTDRAAVNSVAPPAPPNQNPSNISLSGTSVAENQPANTTIGTISGSDPDGDALTYSIVSGGANFNQLGTTLRSSASFNYESASSYSITIRASDGKTGTLDRSFTINVTDVNEPPAITTTKPAAVSMSEDGNPTPFSLTLNATDPDAGAVLTWSIATPAGTGTASTTSGTGSSNSINYAAPANFNGSDSFVVQVSDGSFSDTIPVNVTVIAVNDNPVVVVPAAQSARVNQPWTFGAQTAIQIHNSISASDLDAGSSNVEATLEITHGTLGLTNRSNLSFTSGTGSGNETSVVFSAPLTSVNAALDGLTFQPAAGYSGAAVLSVRVSDLGNTGTPGATSNTQTVTIQLTNPTAFEVDDSFTSSTPGWGFTKFASIQPAIDAAGGVISSGGTAPTVSLAAGVYPESVNLNQNISLSQAGDVQLTGSLSLGSGAWNAGSSNLSLNGNLGISGGAFNRGTGDIAFVGSGPHQFSGSATFNTVSVASGNTLQLADNANLGYTGTIALSGTGALDAATSPHTTITLAGSSPQSLPSSPISLRDVVINTGATLNAPTQLNLLGNLTNNGSFNPQTGQVSLAGSTAQQLNGGLNFYDLTVNNPAGAAANQAVIVANHLNLANGAFQPTSGSALNQVTIANGAELRAPLALSVGGNWNNLGTFTHNDGVLSFNGSSAQALTGNSAQTFGSLVFNNPLGVNAGSLSTVDIHDFTLNSGSFTAPATLNVSGDFASQGVFDANQGLVKFNGSGPQTFTGTAVLHDLDVDNSILKLADNANLGYSGAFDLLGSGSFDPLTNSNTSLTLAGSTPQTLPSGVDTLQNLVINLGATLTAPATLDLSKDLTNNGTFAHNTGRVNFTGSGPQNISGSGATHFYDLNIANTAVSPSDSQDVDSDAIFDVAHTLSLTSGQFQPSVCADLVDVVINSGTILKPDGAKCIQVSGNWLNSGTFNPNGSSVTFDGSGPQTIEGDNNTFYQLTVANTAEFPGDDVDVDSNRPILVTDTLTVNSGQFQPETGSTFKNVIVSAGTLRPDSAGSFNVTGDWSRSSNGWFEANSGNVTFSGSGAQTITGGATFYDLTIQNGGGLNDTGDVDPDVAVTVDHNLVVQAGQFQPPANSKFRNVDIRTGAQLKPDGNITIGGNLSNAGSYSHNARAVTIDGGGVQEMGGIIDFYNLTINAGSTLKLMDQANLGYAGAFTLKGSLDAVSQAHTTVTVKGSQPQSLPNNLALHDLVINSDSTLNAPTQLSLTGDFIRLGTFDHKDSLVIFKGSGPQTLHGSTTFKNIRVVGSTRLGIAAGDSLTLTGTMTQQDTGALDSSATDSTLIIAGSGSDHALPNGSKVHHLTIQSALNAPASLTLTGDWNNSGAFTANGGTVLFDGSAAQSIGGPNQTTFNNLTVSSSVEVTTPRDLAVSNLLEVAQGNFQLYAGSDLHSVQIDNGATLTPSGNLTVSGDWTRAAGGTFAKGSHSVTFDGSAGQGISGGNFYNLTIQNSAATPASAPVVTSDAVTVSSLLQVADGQFNPFCGSDFASVIIDANGSLVLPACVEGVTVSGNWTNNGGLDANGGLVTFDGSSAQTIAGSQPNAFQHLDIKNTSGGVSASGGLPMSGDLTVYSGSFSVANGAAFKHVTIKNGATLVGPLNGAFTVAGNWMDENASGGFNANGSKVLFSGAGTQTFAGKSTFHDIEVGTGATLQAAPNADLGLSGSLTLTGTGALDLISQNATLSIASTDSTPLPSGLTLHHLVIRNDADFHAPAELTIEGNWTNDGTFTPGTGSIVNFTSATDQSIGGSGETDFKNLHVEKSGGNLTATRSLKATGSLIVGTGTGSFTPGSGSQFGDVTIANGATLDGSAGTLSVSGQWDNSGTGTFVPGNGMVVFNGGTGANQTINNPSLKTFNDLQIDGGARLVNTTGPIKVTRDLIVNANHFSPDLDSIFTNISINTGGIFDMPASGQITINGTWANYGSVAINGTTVVGTYQVMTTYVSPVYSSGTTAGYGLDHFKRFNNIEGTTELNPCGPDTCGAVDKTADDGTVYVAVRNDFGSAVLNRDITIQLAGDATFSSLDISKGTFDATRAALFTVNGNYTQTGGTFNAPAAGGSNGKLVVNGDFNLNTSGTYEASNGTLAVAGNLAQGTGTTFNPHSGTLELIGGSNPQSVDVVATLYDLSINKTNNADEVQLTSPIQVSHDTVIQKGKFTTIADNSQFVNLTIESNGTLAIPTGIDAHATGIFTNRGMLAIASGGQLFATLTTVYVDKNYFTGTTSGYGFDHLDNITQGIAAVANAGRMIVYPGNFSSEDVTLPAGRNLTMALSGTSETLVQVGDLIINDGAVLFSAASSDSSPATSFTGTLQIAGDLALAGDAVFAPTGGTVEFNGTLAQALTGSFSFDGLTINNSAADPATVKVTTGSAVTVTGLLNIADGRFKPACSSIFQDVTIAAAGELELGTTCSISVSGDWSTAWTTSGGLNANGSKVIFNGSGAQLVHGTYVELGAVQIDANASLQPDNTSTLHLAGDWTNNGAFVPGSSTVTFVSGSHALAGTLNFGGFTIAGGSTVTPASATPLIVNGDWLNAGAFVPNSGTVVFSGGGDQTISGATIPQPFYNLTLNQTPSTRKLTASQVLGITNDLDIISGELVLQRNASVAQNAKVWQNGTLTMNGTLILDVTPEPAVMTVAGNWNSTGTYHPTNGYVSPAAVTAVYVNPDFTSATPGWNIDHFASLQAALNPQVIAGALITVSRGADGILDQDTNVIVNKDVTISFAAGDYSLSGNLTLNQGTWNAPTGTFALGGNLTRDPVADFRAGSGTLELNGSAAQSIGSGFSGVNQFNHLVLNNAAGASVAAADIAGTLTTQAGELTLATGSSVHDVVLTAGSLKAGSGAALSITGNWNAASGTFSANGGTVTFNTYNNQATTNHDLNGTANFNNLVIAANNILHLNDGANLGLAGALTLDGNGSLDARPAGGHSTLTLNGSGEQSLPSGLLLDNLVIGENSDFHAPAQLALSGNLTNDGIFNPNGGKVTFDGSGVQAIDGNNWVDFNDLTVAGNDTLTPTFPMSVSGDLAVDRGPFAPLAGSIFNNVTISSPNGVFSAPNGQIDIKGNFANAHTFTPGTGSVHFSGASAQVISGTGTFYDLFIENSAGVDATGGASLAVQRDLRVVAGMFKTPSVGADLENVVISTGTLDGSAGNLTVSGNWTDQNPAGTGGFVAGEKTVTFDGTPPQSFSGHSNFHDVTIGNGSTLHLANGSNLGLSGALDLGASGSLDARPAGGNSTLTLNGSGMQSLPSGLLLNHLVIGPNSDLQVPAELNLSGDLTNHGVFSRGTGTVTLDGSGPQTIGGSHPTTFNNLEVNNISGSAPVIANPAVAVAGNLTLTDGEFRPAAGSDFSNVTIGANGDLYAPAGAPGLTVSGNWNNSTGGAFHANGGTVTFDGNSAQDIYEPGSFASSLSIANSGTQAVTSNPAVTVSGPLTISDGTFDPATGSTFNDVEIANGAELDGRGSNLTVNSNWTNRSTSHGGYLSDPSSQVSFNGGGTHVFSGETSFNTVNLGSGTLQQANGSNLILSGEMTETGGTVSTAPNADATFTLAGVGSQTLPDGLALHTLVVGSTTNFQVPTTLALSGDLTNHGSVNANGSQVTFNGSGAQAINGENPVDFNNLTVVSGTLTPAHPMTVGGTLAVNGGTFAPLTGSTFRDVAITSGTFNAPNGRIDITGNFNNTGSFDPGSGTVRFNGTGEQTISGHGTFANLAIENAGGVDASDASDLSVSNDLAVITGTLQTPVNADLQNVGIGAGGTLDGSAGNLTVGGNWQDDHVGGGFTAGTGTNTVSFDGTGTHSFGGASVFHNLTVQSGDLAATTPITVGGALAVTGGAFAPQTSSTFHDVVISGGTLNAPNGRIDLTGNFNNTGTFDPGSGTVHFSGGPGAQTISGHGTFANLAIENAGGVNASGASDLSVSNDLTVTAGTFQSPANADLQNVSIGPGGTLDGSAGNLTVGGNWDDQHASGGFVAGTGANTVTFDGAGTHTYTGASSFHHVVLSGSELELGASSNLGLTGNLAVANNGTLDARSHEPNTLSLLGSGTHTIPSGLALDNLTIGTGSTLIGPQSLSVAGDWTNNGTFTPGSGTQTVTFDGGATQTIGGSTSPANFNNLVVAGADTIVDPAVALDVADTLNVSGGTVQIPNGSTLNNVSVGSSGGLVFDPGAQVSLNGQWTNNGTVNTNGGSVTTDPDTTVITTVFVDSAYTPSTSGWNIDRFDTIQGGFDRIAVNGTVTIYGGSYTENATLNRNANVVMLPSLAATPVPDVTLTGNLDLQQGVITGPAAALKISGNLTLGSGATFNANNGQVVMNGSGPQAISGSFSFSKLEILNTAAAPADGQAVSSTPIVITNLLDVQDGQFMPACQSDFVDVSIGTDGILKPQDGPCTQGWTVSGNWTNDGSFMANDSLITFDGDADQAIAGTHATDFANLTLANLSEASLDAESVVTVTGKLSVEMGRFQPVTGSTIHDLSIGEFGVILPDSGATLNITGNVDNLGRFSANGETVVFNGTGHQTITGAITFNNLTVNKNPATDSVEAAQGVRVENSLTLTSGQFRAPDGSVFNNVAVGANGDLTIDPNASVVISGNVTNAGTFGANGAHLTVGGSLTNSGRLTAQNSTLRFGGDLSSSGTFDAATGTTVVFNGSGHQNVTGSFSFYDLSIENTADPANDANDVDFVSPLIVTHNTNVVDGQFQPLAGSAFNNLAIDINGIFRPNPAGIAVIAIGGDFSNLGQLQANGVTIEGGRFSNVSVSGAYDSDTPGYSYDKFSSLNAAIAKVIETGNVQVYSGTYVENVLINKEVHITVSQSITIDGNLTFQRSIPGIGGNLIAPAAGVINITGNLSVVDGTLNTNGGTLAFTGSGAQTIQGLYTFDHLTIANSYASPDDSHDVDSDQPVIVHGLLKVSDGQFQPPACSDFANVTIETNGILKPDGTGCSGAITVSGDWDNTGSFLPGSGSVVLDGSTLQNISGSTTFNNLLVQNPGGASASGGLNVQGNLNLHTGSFDLPNGAILQNVVIETGGSLGLSAGGVTVTGDWTDQHSEHPSQGFVSDGGTVTFGGADVTHAFSGETVFGNLAVAGGSSLQLASGSTLGLTGSLAVNPTGTFDATRNPGTTLALLGDGTPHQTISSGVSLDNLVIGSGAIVEGAGNSLNVAGNWANNGGTFTPGNGSVVFNGSGPQDIGGTTQTTFNNLEIANTSSTTPPAHVTTSRPPAVGNILTLTDGVFTPSTGTDLTHVLIQGGGSLEPVSGASLNVAGDFTNNGAYQPNAGTIVFDGSAPQNIGGSASPMIFYNLVVQTTANPASGGGVVLQVPVRVDQGLNVTNGQLTQIRTGSQFNDLNIGSGGSVTLSSGAAIQVLGAYTNTQGGTFNANGGKLAPNNIKLTGTDAGDPNLLKVVEHLPAGTLAATLSTIDLDYITGDTCSYALVTGVGSEGNAAFEINGNELRTAVRVNYEDHPSYSVRIQTTDKDGLTLQKAFTIQIGDLNEAPTFSEASPIDITIDEDNNPQAFDLTLNATDLDNDPIQWEILQQAAHGVASIAAGDPGVSKSIGFVPELDWFGQDTFTLKVSDGRSGSAELTVNVTVRSRNDAPVMSETPVVTAPTLVQIGSKLTVTSGAWNDNKDKQPGSMTITYQWQRADPPGTGTITPISDAVHNEYILTPADQGRLLRVIVTATDNGSGEPAQMSTAFASGWTTVDGHTPTNLQLSQNSVLAHTPADTQVGLLSVSEIDPSDTFSYGLVNGQGSEDNAAFRIVDNALIAATELGVNDKHEYTIRVRATDGGGNQVESVLAIAVVANQVSVEPGIRTTYEFTGPQSMPGTVTLKVAENSIITPVTLAFTFREFPSLMLSPAVGDSALAPKAQINKIFAHYGFDLSAYQDGIQMDDYKFANPISMTVSYDPKRMKDVFAKTLEMRMWNGTDWVNDNACGQITVQPEKSTLQISVCRTGQLALFGVQKFDVFIPSVSR